MNIQSTNEINTSIESLCMKSPNKDDNLVKNIHQIVTYDQPNYLNNDRQLVDYENDNNKHIFSVNLPLKTYDPKMYYNYDPCLGDNNITTYVRRSITLNIHVEDSNKTSKFLVINDIRDFIVKNNNKYIYTRQSIMYNGNVLKNLLLDSLNIGKTANSM